MKKNLVDVNVHPAKTEVKFVNERALFDVIYHTVQEALAQEDGAPPLRQTGAQKAPSAAAPPAHQERNPQFYQSMTAEAYRNKTAAPRPPLFAADSELKDTSGLLRDSAGTQGFLPEQPAPVSHAVSPVISRKEAEEPELPPAKQVEPEPEQLPWRVAGEIFGTYIIAEQGNRILLIDKHAAHERMHFERFKEENYVPMGQVLLVPLVFHPSGEAGEALRRNLPLLSEYGFEAEDFGGGSLIVRQVPHDIDPEQAQEVLAELGERLSSGAQADPGSARDSLLKTLACKAAIKAGQKNGVAELEAVAAAVISGAVKYCPHGRPVAVEMTRGCLDRQFGRA